MSVQVCEQQGSAFGGLCIHSGQMISKAECVMYVCLVRFQSIPASDGLFCGLVPSITILIHFVVYLLPTLPPRHSAPF